MPALVKELVHLAKHTAVYGLANVLGKAIGFMLIPLYTHYITPNDYGVLELLDLSITVIGMFVGIGLASALAKFYFDYDTKAEKDLVVSTALFVITIAASIMLVIAWPLASVLADVILDNEEYTVYLKIGLVTFACNALIEIPLTYIRARERSMLFGSIALSRLFVSLSLNIYFVVVAELGILGILYSGLITSILVSFVLVCWTVKDVGARINLKLGGFMVTFGAPLIVSSLGMFLINFGDRFLLKEYASLAEVGVYSLGYKIGMGLISFLIGQPFFLIWSVRRYSLVKEDDGLARYGQIFLLYMLLLLAIWYLISIFSREIIVTLSPDEYLHAWEILPFIAFGYIFREMSDFFRGAFLIQGRTGMVGRITLIATVFCLLSYMLLIPRYHSMGAAVATVMTFVLMAGLSWHYAQKLMPVDYRLGRVGLVASLFVFSAGATVYMLPAEIRPMLMLMKVGICLTTVYLAMLVAFDRNERKDISRLAAAMLRKVIRPRSNA